ncbi:MAG: FAD-binding protein [Clostridia bacterium]|nr:FAD-binding protein [Clostridia bacterium]
MRKIYDAIIIGSGAAAYSAADWLYKEGITDIAIITENRLSGTSRNTGSDKQTYYKMSMDGNSLDSPYKMAQDIFSAGCCDGEKMYLQSVNSIKCFLRLCDYGVGFPQDKFGGFPGYKTDHDNTVRATSIGPLTSKVMTEKLENAVLYKNRTPLLDNRQVVEILKEGNRAIGVAALNTETNEFECFYSQNTICATGAPACIYENSVYPESQHGMTGVLLEAGVHLCNFAQWQYGMASVDFRWNVSGSFMQVIPRFVSVDENGNEHDFLNCYFETAEEMCGNIFLKGYQWPFSFERAKMSSNIDIAVHNEVEKGRKVYLDYTANPKGFCFDNLDNEARQYLEKNNATGDTPVERLKKLNSKAIDVYLNQKIDISKEKLRIAVCAQHNNGGVYTDNNCETDVKGLYVIGEAAGTFGLARPGGTALNDTQVSGLLCARHITEKSAFSYDFEAAECCYEKYKDFITDNDVDYSYLKTKMSRCAAFLRNREECVALLDEINDKISNYPLRHKSLSDYFYDKDMLISAKALLETIIGEMPLTGSRGGAVYFEKGEIAAENPEYRKYLTITENGKVLFEKAKPVPKNDEPFEKYLNKI